LQQGLLIFGASPRLRWSAAAFREEKVMRSRGEIRFIKFPRFAAGLYSRLTRTASLQQQYQEIAACLSGQVKSGRLLDVGTGPGRLLLEVHRLNPELQLYGLDISLAMIELARKNLAGVTADLKVANVCTTGYESDFFDVVTCTGSFYLWDQPEKGLEEIHRILKSGGSVHLLETHRDYDHDAYRAALKTNLKREGLAMRLFGPLLLAEALRMAYRADEVAEIVGRTSFSGGCRIENLSLVGLPIWMHIQLTKASATLS
jgi:ubiquinone/menaquinone biosynthesis C-methylase UbiE